MRMPDFSHWLAGRLMLFGAVALVELASIWRSATPLMQADAMLSTPVPSIMPDAPRPRPLPQGAQPRTDAMLARPLFMAGRAPPDAAAPAPATPAIPPRLTGLVIAQGERWAIFTGPDNRRPTTVAEGGALGPFTVTSIKPNEVELAGPQGVHRLRLAADADLRSRFATHYPVVALIDPVRREAETETDQ